MPSIDADKINGYKYGVIGDVLGDRFVYELNSESVLIKTMPSSLLLYNDFRAVANTLDRQEYYRPITELIVDGEFVMYGPLLSNGIVANDNYTEYQRFNYNGAYGVKYPINNPGGIQTSPFTSFNDIGDDAESVEYLGGGNDAVFPQLDEIALSNISNYEALLFNWLAGTEQSLVKNEITTNWYRSSLTEYETYVTSSFHISGYDGSNLDNSFSYSADYTTAVVNPATPSGVFDPNNPNEGTWPPPSAIASKDVPLYEAVENSDQTRGPMIAPVESLSYSTNSTTAERQALIDALEVGEFASDTAYEGYNKSKSTIDMSAYITITQPPVLSRAPQDLTLQHVLREYFKEKNPSINFLIPVVNKALGSNDWTPAYIELATFESINIMDDIAIIETVTLPTEETQTRQLVLGNLFNPIYLYSITKSGL